MEFHNQNKNKQLYSTKLSTAAPDIYETYQKMKYNQKISNSNQNTLQTSIETIKYPSDNYSYITKYYLVQNNLNTINQNQFNNTKKNRIHRIKEDKPHLSYLGFIKQKGLPFAHEKRFKWQNLNEHNYPSAMINFPNISRHYKIKSYFQKGFKGFYDMKNKDIVERNSHRKHIQLPSNDISFNRTRRVLDTSIDDKSTDYFERRHKKCSSIDKYNKYVNCGRGVAGIIRKTPWKINNRGIRIVKRNRSSDLNLFRDDYSQSFDRTRLLTVRNRFTPKDHDIFGVKKNKSMDYINFNDNTNRQQKNVDFNYNNWKINNSNNLDRKKIKSRNHFYHSKSVDKYEF
jgi:hypothetical protein